jgi:hypothetical protein
MTFSPVDFYCDFQHKIWSVMIIRPSKAVLILFPCRKPHDNGSRELSSAKEYSATCSLRDP